jgi:hypothetical protein
MRFAFIAAKKAEHRVTILCRCMRVTRSGFYAWVRRGLSARAQRDLVLRTKLRAFHAASGDRYGRPRLWKDLREDGEAVSEKRVRRLMQDERIQGRVRGSSTHDGSHPPTRSPPMCRPRLHRGGADHAGSATRLNSSSATVPSSIWRRCRPVFALRRGRAIMPSMIGLTLKALEMAVARCPRSGLCTTRIVAALPANYDGPRRPGVYLQHEHAAIFTTMR